MKKTFLAALFTCSFSLTFAKQPLVEITSTAIPCVVNLTKPVDMTLRSANGATVRLVGNINFSLAPSSISSFSGTVTITGGTGPTGTMAFSIGGKVMSVQFDTQDIKRVRSIRWSGNPLSSTFVAVLNEAGINSSLVALFNTFG